MKRNGRMKGTRKYDNRKTRIQLSWDMLINYETWKVLRYAKTICYGTAIIISLYSNHTL